MARARRRSPAAGAMVIALRLILVPLPGPSGPGRRPAGGQRAVGGGRDVDQRPEERRAAGGGRAGPAARVQRRGDAARVPGRRARRPGDDDRLAAGAAGRRSIRRLPAPDRRRGHAASRLRVTLEPPSDDLGRQLEGLRRDGGRRAPDRPARAGGRAGERHPHRPAGPGRSGPHGRVHGRRRDARGRDLRLEHRDRREHARRPRRPRGPPAPRACSPRSRSSPTSPSSGRRRRWSGRPAWPPSSWPPESSAGRAGPPPRSAGR